jgi:hypothetical protein
MFKKIFNWMFCSDNQVNNEPIVKTIGTVVECNAMECMDNFEGQCILTNISLEKPKLYEKNMFYCSEYSTEDQDLKNDFNKEVVIHGCN